MSSSSSLAPKSAQNSLKRSRILYDVNPQAAFLPTADPTIVQASINRRKRRVQPQQHLEKQRENSNAIVLVTEGASSSTTANKSAPSQALVPAVNGNANDANDDKGKGILVVRLCFLFS